MAGIIEGRQRKYLVGAFWISIWFLFGILLSVVVKDLVKENNFRYEGHLALLHFLGQALFARLLFKTGVLGDLPAVNPKERRLVWKTGFYTVLQIVIMNMVFRYLSLSFSTILKNLSPLMIYFISIAYRMDRFSCRVFFAILMVCIGTAATAHGNMQANTIGVVLCGLGILAQCMRWICIQQLGNGISAAAQMYYVQSAAAILLIPYCVFEGPGFAEAIPTFSMHVWYLVAASTIMASLFMLGCFNICYHTSATTMTVLGNIRGVVQVVIGLLFYNELKHYKFTGIVGIGVSLAGSLLYGIIRKSKGRLSYTTEERMKPRDAVRLPSRDDVETMDDALEVHRIDSADLEESDDDRFYVKGAPINRRWHALTLGWCAVAGYGMAVTLVATGIVPMPHAHVQYVTEYSNSAVQYIKDTSASSAFSSAGQYVVEQTTNLSNTVIDTFNNYILGPVLGPMGQKVYDLGDDGKVTSDSVVGLDDVSHHLLGVKAWTDKRAFVVPGATGERGVVSALGPVDWLSNTACQVPTIDLDTVQFTNSTGLNLSDEQRSQVFNHLRVWRHVIEHGLDYALVIEDDLNVVVDKSEFDKYWDSMFDTIKSNDKAHIFQMQVSSANNGDPVWLLGQDLDARPHVVSELSPGIAEGSGMYFITNTGARHLIRRFQENPLPIGSVLDAESEHGFHFSPGIANHKIKGRQPSITKPGIFKNQDARFKECTNFAAVAHEEHLFSRSNTIAKQNIETVITDAPDPEHPPASEPLIEAADHRPM